MPSWKILTAGLGDEEAISSIQRDVWLNHFLPEQDPNEDQALIAAQPERMAYWTRILADSPPHRVSLARIEDLDQIAGYLHVIRVREGGSYDEVRAFNPTTDEDCGPTAEVELLNMGVHPAHQRRGVGSALLSSASRACRATHSSAGLWVAESNARAQRLYVRHGWRFADRTRTTTVDGTPTTELRMLMMKDFP